MAAQKEILYSSQVDLLFLDDLKNEQKCRLYSDSSSVDSDFQIQSDNTFCNIISVMPMLLFSPTFLKKERILSLCPQGNSRLCLVGCFFSLVQKTQQLKTSQTMCTFCSVPAV